jgi:signal peptidase I
VSEHLSIDGRPPGRGDHIARWIIIPLWIVLLLVVGVFWFVFTTVRVDGDSMLPTLRNNDRVLVTKGYTVPIRGDIVSSMAPARGGGEESIIKRVIGIPGDEIVIKGDVVFVNGTREPGIDHFIVGPEPYDTIGPIRVPPGRIFVVGDNRPDSMDSRFAQIGFIPIEKVNGRAVAIFAPWGRIRLLPQHDW